MIWEKAKSLYDNLKQKEGDGSNAGEFNDSKGWFDNFKKRFGLKKVKITGETVLKKIQQTSSQMTLRKSLIWKDICLNRFLIQTKLSYSGKKMPLGTFINKEEEWAPGLKAGRDRLTLLFCANAVRCMIRTALIYKAANPQALKGKGKHQLPVFWLYKKDWTMNSFSESVSLMLCPWSQEVPCQEGTDF